MVLVLGFSLFALAGYGVTLAQVDHDPLKFYFEDNPLRVGIETLDEHVAGAGSMSVLVERDGGVKDLALLQKMESFEKRLREYKNPVTGKHLVTGVAGLLSVIKRDQSRP